MRPSTDRPPTDRRVTVFEASSILGITPDAVRSRLRRGTLTKEVGEDGTVYVRLDADGPNGRTDQTTDRLTDQTTVAYINALKSQIEYLKEVVEKRDEEIRRRDHLLAAALERIPPALEEAPPQLRESPETASETGAKGDDVPNNEQWRPWRRRFFGLD
jgi:hypothetical protein